MECDVQHHHSARRYGGATCAAARVAWAQSAPCRHISTDLAALNADVLERARPIAFVTPEIVSKRILARLGYGAFNFHPGPPSYPGWAPAHFALCERAAEFGATVHVMVEQVDADAIDRPETDIPPSAMSLCSKQFARPERA